MFRLVGASTDAGFIAEGKTFPPLRQARIRLVTDDYFEAIGMRIVAVDRSGRRW